MGWIFLGNAVEFWWNPIILLTGDVSLRYLSELEIVSVNVREVIVAGWWCGWELCSELGSFGSTVTQPTIFSDRVLTSSKLDSGFVL